MKPTPPFADVADALGTSVAIVEKDYYTVGLLRFIQNIDFQNKATLIFSGGTCLTKVYAKNDRMSEDVDLKLVLEKSVSTQSNLARKKVRCVY